MHKTQREQLEDRISDDIDDVLGLESAEGKALLAKMKRTLQGFKCQHDERCKFTQDMFGDDQGEGKA